MIDLRFNYPVLPTQHQQLRASLAALPASDDYLRMAPANGFDADRQQAAAWLSRPGYPITADQIQLCNGGHHALAAVALAARLAGSTVVADPLTYNGLLALAAQLGFQVLACPADEDGLLPEALAELCQHTPVRALYLMPTIHNPLGLVMPPTRRQALVRVARQFDLLLIDDDAYGFLEPVALPSFAHLAPERSFYIYSLSKPIAPGIKLAYLVAPAEYRAALETSIRVTGGGGAVLFARLVAEWIANGELSRLLEQKRAEAARRQALVQRLFGTELPYTARSTSFHLWVPVPAPLNVATIEQNLTRQGVLVVSSLAYQVSDAQPSPGIRLALGNATDDAALTEGLTQVLHQLRPAVGL